MCKSSCVFAGENTRALTIGVCKQMCQKRNTLIYYLCTYFISVFLACNILVSSICLATVSKAIYTSISGLKPNNPSVTEEDSVLPCTHRGVRVNNTTARWQSHTVLQQWANTLQNNSSVSICYDMQTMSNNFKSRWQEIATNCGSTEQFVYLLEHKWAQSTRCTRERKKSR